MQTPAKCPHCGDTEIGWRVLDRSYQAGTVVPCPACEASVRVVSRETDDFLVRFVLEKATA